MAADGKSGSELERVVLADSSRLVVKHVRLGRDWIGRGTHAGGRVATLWHSGLFALVHRRSNTLSSPWSLRTTAGW
jgi:hypothetical protein